MLNLTKNEIKTMAITTHPMAFVSEAVSSVIDRGVSQRAMTIAVAHAFTSAAVAKEVRENFWAGV